MPTRDADLVLSISSEDPMYEGIELPPIRVVMEPATRLISSHVTKALCASALEKPGKRALGSFTLSLVGDLCPTSAVHVKMTSSDPLVAMPFAQTNATFSGEAGAQRPSHCESQRAKPNAPRAR